MGREREGEVEKEEGEGKFREGSNEREKGESRKEQKR